MILDKILHHKAKEVADAKERVPLDLLKDQAMTLGPARDFAGRLREKAVDGTAIIAEVKKGSPSRGVIREDFDPVEIARIYERAGAACLSVLTDTPYFQGEDAHLAAARSAVDLPILRKDFMIDPYQVVEARSLGADCILVILAAVDDALARDLIAAADGLGMDALIEVHDAAEMARAVALTKGLIGINNRNLKTLQVDLQTSVELAPSAPAGTVVVCESGLGSRGDLDRMAAAGVRCFLIGESFMRQRDVTAAVRAMLTPVSASAAAGIPS